MLAIYYFGSSVFQKKLKGTLFASCHFESSVKKNEGDTACDLLFLELNF